jgi:hypothetical protein
MTRIATAKGARQRRAHRQFESARPDHFSFTNTLHPAMVFAADPRSTPTCHPPPRMTQISTARGARQSRALRQFKSARPDHFSFTNTLHPAMVFAADPRSTPTCHPPQRMTRTETARGARQRRAHRQFKSARPDHLNQ